VVVLALNKAKYCSLLRPSSFEVSVFKEAKATDVHSGSGLTGSLVMKVSNAPVFLFPVGKVPLGS
jgi:hypothetical protein